MNGDAFSPEQLGALREFLPTTAEQKSLAEFKGPRSELTEGEQFMCEIMAVPNCDQRLEGLLFQSVLPSRVSAIHGDLEVFQRCCKSIMESVRFRKLLKIVLDLGNRLNHGREEASAIKLESLLPPDP